MRRVLSPVTLNPRPRQGDIGSQGQVERGKKASDILGGIATQHCTLVKSTHFLLPSPCPGGGQREELVPFLFFSPLFCFVEVESPQTSFPPRLLRPMTGNQQEEQNRTGHRLGWSRKFRQDVVLTEPPISTAAPQSLSFFVASAQYRDLTPASLRKNR